MKIVDPETIHLVTDGPFPLLLERLVFFPIVPKKHVEKVGRPGLRHARRRWAPAPGSSWSGSATSTSASRRSTGTGAGKPPFKTLIFRGDAGGGHPDRRAQDRRRGPHPQRVGRPRPRPQGQPPDLRHLGADPARPLRPPRHAHGALRQEGGPPGRQPRDRPRGDRPEDDGRARHQVVPTVVQPAAFGYDPASRRTPTIPRRPRSCSPRPATRTAWTSRCTAGSSSSGRVFEAIGQMLTEVGHPHDRRRCGTRARPGTSSSRAKARPPTGTTGAGATTRSSTPTPSCTRSITPSRAAGSASGTSGSKGSTASSTRRAPRSTRARRKRTYTQIQRLIKEEAPSIFLFHQYDTLGVSKKVEYAGPRRRVAVAVRRQAQA